MSPLRVLVRPVAALTAFVLAGALCGVLWEWLWEPPTGLVVSGRWVLEPAGPDLAFSETGWYVVIAVAAGAVLAGAIGWAFPGRELVTLVAAVLGAFVAGWLMFRVGHALGPPDPRVLAAGEDDLVRLPADLRVAGAGTRPSLLRPESSAFAAFPAGAALGLMAVFLTGRGRTSRGRQTRG